MNRILAYALVATGLFASSSAALAQSSATATASGSTTIIRPITIAKDVDLAFGRIVKPSSGSGTVAIADTGDSVTAGLGAVALSGITTSRAKFTVDGEGGQAVSLAIPANFDMVLSSDATKKITVNLDPDLASSITLSNALGSAGAATLYVGGSFALPSTTSTGAYSGTFSVTAAYQ